MTHTLSTAISKLLELDAKRTGGTIQWGWRPGDKEAPGSIFAMPREGHAYAMAMCPRYGREQFPIDAEYFVSMPLAVSVIRKQQEMLEVAIKALEWMRTETAPPVHGTMADMPTINAVWEVADKTLTSLSGDVEV